MSLHLKSTISIIIGTEHPVIKGFLNKDAAGSLEYLSRPRVNCSVDDRLCSVGSALAYMSNPLRGILRYTVCLKESDFTIGNVFILHEYTNTLGIG